MTVQWQPKKSPNFSDQQLQMLAPVLHTLLAENPTTPALKLLADRAGMPRHHLQMFFKTLPFAYGEWVENHRRRLYPRTLPPYLQEKFLHAQERAMERYGYELSLRDYQQLTLKIKHEQANFLMKMDKGQLFQVELNNQTFYAIVTKGKILTFYHKGWVKQQADGEYARTVKKSAQYVRRQSAKAAKAQI